MGETNKEKKKRGIIIPTITTIALLILLTVSTYFSYVYKSTKDWNGLIYPGVLVADVDVGGKTEEEAIDLLRVTYAEAIKNKTISIKTNKKTYDVDYAKLNARYNIEEVVQEAYEYGKDKGMFKKFKLIRESQLQEFSLKFTYDKDYLEELIVVMEEETLVEPVSATIKMGSDRKFQITPDSKGYKLQVEELQALLDESINGDLNSSVVIDAPIEELRAKVTKEELSTIDTVISSFQTSFATSAEGRSNNIRLATRYINGTLLMPGDSFSFNKTVGQRTIARGFQEAPIIIGNRIDAGVGGGICQVSSTLYNAALLSNLGFDERVNHTLTLSYVGLGFDATVDWGNIDYRFTNTLDYPIYIEGTISNKVLTFRIHSNKSLTNRTYKLVNRVLETIPAQVKYEDDPELEVGKTEIVQEAKNGYRVRVFRQTFENGKMIKEEVISTDTYKVAHGLIKKGTKKIPEKAPERTPERTPSTTPDTTPDE
jgi:vancomycin resistance protein YoaR